jgi:hypothetical protein
MLRKFLKAINKDDTNPNAAFRTRENPKMRTRRAQKANDAEGLDKMKSLKSDMDVAITLLGNIKYRELIKLELFELSLLSKKSSKFLISSEFESTIKEKTDASNTVLLQKFKENYENDKYLAMKNRMKEFNKNAVKFINEYREQNLKAVPEVASYIKPLPQTRVNFIKNRSSTITEEPNFDLGCFIASVAEEAHNRDITMIKIQNLDLLPGQAEQLASPPSMDKTIMEDDKRGRIDLSRVRSTTAVPVVPGQHEDKNIFKYKLRKRYDRFGRVVLEKMFEEDENDFTVHNKEYYEKQFEQRIPLLTSEVVDKLHNGKGASKDSAHEYETVHELYVDRFSKYSDIYPFMDSDDDQDLQEFTKQIKKNTATNFRTFLRQKKQFLPVSVLQ